MVVVEEFPSPSLSPIKEIKFSMVSESKEDINKMEVESVTSSQLE